MLSLKVEVGRKRGVGIQMKDDEGRSVLFVVLDPVLPPLRRDDGLRVPSQ